MLKRMLITSMAVFPIVVAAQDVDCDKMDIEFNHPYAQIMSHDYVDLALYLAIVNNDNVDHTLSGVISPGAKQGVFDAYYGPAGPKTLQPLTQLTIPAGGTMVFQPGDNHIRFLNYQKRPNGGDHISATFTFDNGCSKEVDDIIVKDDIHPSN